MEQNPILNAKLSMDSDIPLYAQLVGIIKRNISTGALAVGDLLPSEAELCRWMNISRNTVRQAIGELEDEGLVVRKRGRGTFVADPATNRRGVRYSFTTEVSSLGKVPSSTLIDFDVIVPNQAVCEKMGWELKLEPIDWDAKDALLGSGNIFFLTSRSQINHIRRAADPGDQLLSPVHLSPSDTGHAADPQLLQPPVPCGHRALRRRREL